MKVCSRCKEEKSLNSFYNDKRGILGKDNYCKSCRKITAKMYRQQKHVKDRHRNSNLFDKYGITQQDYDTLLSNQGGVCAICGGSDHQGHLYSRRKVDYFSVDHCHTTGNVRGLLCLSCNIALGNYKDDIDMLRKAISYLEMTSN